MAGVDALTQLVFALHSSPGVYALLLGSGVSSGAGIPTGWAIVEDLIRRVARLTGAEPTDVFTWYREQYATDAEYTSVLEKLASTAPDRRNILRRYFEPTPEERERKEKLPGRAHRAIAELIARGDVRVIMTTNFDPLIEMAIREQGVQPQIVSTADAAAGCMPLAHAPCTVIKVNGDYLDTRIRNTVGELVQYEEPVARLIRQVFDEYGLVVCGWSADWDAALQSLLSAAPRRFATFWCHRGPLTDVGARTAEFRSAQLIPIESADLFFEQVAGKVQALRAIDAAHPASVAAAAQEIKHYMTAKRYRIRLADTIRKEANAVVSVLNQMSLDLSAKTTPAFVQATIRRFDAVCERLVAMLAVGCYWAEAVQEKLFADAVTAIATFAATGHGGNPWLLAMTGYPAMLCLYAAGIAALAGERYTLLRTLLDTRLRIQEPQNEFIRSDFFVERSYAQNINPEQNYFVPLSEHLFACLKDRMAKDVLDPAQFDRVFDRFEYFAALQFAALEPRLGWAPAGRFAYKLRRGSVWPDYRAIGDDVSRQGNDWPPVRHGLFGGTCAESTTSAGCRQLFLPVKVSKE